MAFGWTCVNCTYYHHASSERCAMCGELRVTRQQMRDFVRGVPIPKDDGKPPSTYSETTITEKKSLQQMPLNADVPEKFSQPSVHFESNVNSSQLTKRTFIRNPYAKAAATKRTTTSISSGAKTTNTTLSAHDAVASRSVSFPTAQQVLMASRPDLSHPSSALDSATKTVPSAHSLPQAEAHTSVSSVTSTKRSLAEEVKAADLASSSLLTEMRQHNQHPLHDKHPGEATEAEKENLPSFSLEEFQSNVASPHFSGYQPGPVPFDETYIQEWIFPCHDDYPIRQYQLEMTQTAIFHNTLVSLPTGLGKTLIAAVVLCNFYRWFPTGKTIFMAPTLPLVEQQVGACYDIMGIPALVTAVLTGKSSPSLRQDIWNKRSVFFCTPQTVQRDLEGNRLDASKVVCIVLDEAHKSTGDYAYCKVVEAIEKSGAKFRILGLSATPGANIKAIQQVIDALRINKIEARDEDHPSVAPYTHKRESEIVLVKQCSTDRDVERALNDIISPLLDRLRAGGGLPRVSGNATVTSYSILQAKNVYESQPKKDDSIIGYFFAALTFVQMRDWLHKHGVGMVLTKVCALRNEPQRGILAKIVKGDEFSHLYEKLRNDNKCIGPQQAVNNSANNPKLMKLVEVLIEHFKRAEATSSSSRAIVFSQFRESVSEIVSVLAYYGKEQNKALIRPRHFIGQGKGPKSESASHLKGMKQAEQQKVIEEFRSNVHNVLVCTCIGEEGLDIGEVDLIVNFDTLRNPIRMLQRIGRTGRKREGRVVCLVGEGAEERTLKASRQAERNLFHSLKNQKSFVYHQPVPMFPKSPLLRQKKMNVSRFHMSQVEGHGKMAKRPRAQPGSASAESHSLWRLSLGENAERLRLLGQYCTLPLYSKSNITSHLRRRIFVGRMAGTRTAKFAVARTVNLVRAIECFNVDNRPARIAKARGDDHTFSELFPVVREKVAISYNCMTEEQLESHSEKGAELDYDAINRNFSINCLQKDCCNKDSVQQELKSTQSMSSLKANFSGACILSSKFSDRIQSKQSIDRRVECHSKPFEHLIVAKQKSYHRSNGEIDMVVLQNDDDHNLLTVPTESVFMNADESLTVNTAVKNLKLKNGNVMDASNEQCRAVLPNSVSTKVPHQTEFYHGFQLYKDRETFEVEGITSDNVRFNETKESVASLHFKASDDAFCLPTPPDCSSSEEGCVNDHQISIDTKVESRDKKHCHPSMPVDSHDDSLLSIDRICRSTLGLDDLGKSQFQVDRAKPSLTANEKSKESEKKRYEDFWLPTQESSSDDEHSEHSLQSLNKTPCFQDSAESRRNDYQQLTKSNNLTSQECIQCNDDFEAKLFTPCTGDLTDQCLDVPDSNSTALPHRKRTQRVLAIEDTQEQTTLGVPDKPNCNLLENTQMLENSPGFETCVAKLKASENFSDLVDSPTLRSNNFTFEYDVEKNIDDIVCAVCSSGIESNDNPIILCDGPALYKKCHFAVHLDCYSVSKDILADDEWRCDPCNYRFFGGKGPIVCSKCNNSSGVLRQVDDLTWNHLDCKALTKTEKHRLKKLKKIRPVSSKSKHALLSGHVQPLADSLATSERFQESAVRKRRRMNYRRLIDDEAQVSSDDDVDGDAAEEEEIAAIEAFEANIGFINDSSQLGYTQDELGRIDPAANDETVHRELEIERSRLSQFETPILNRRLKRRKNEGKWTETPSSAPDSEKGLGNMHFIRSVLEHCRQGGQTREIENFYNKLEVQQSQINDEDGVFQPATPVRTVIYYQQSDLDED